MATSTSGLGRRATATGATHTFTIAIIGIGRRRLGKLGRRFGPTFSHRLGRRFLRFGRRPVAVSTDMRNRLGLRLGLGLIAGERLAVLSFDPFAFETIAAETVHRTRTHLLAAGKHDAEVVLGVLEEVFRRHAIARGRRIASQREILLIDLIRGAANLAFWAARIERLVSIVAVRWPVVVAARAITRSLTVRYLSHAFSIAVMWEPVPRYAFEETGAAALNRCPPMKGSILEG